ncbi:MAG: aldo/keto reductase, partial [Bacteroidota bacterium]
GLVHLDSAHVYQGGRNEEMLGKLLKDYKRKSFVLATKIHTREMKTETEFLEAFDLSMERLQMDYVDILYLHASDSREHTLDPRWVNALKKIKESGRARHIGVTTHSNEPEVIRAAIESDFYDIVCTSYNYRMEHFQEVKDAIAEASAAGLGVIGMKTMAGVYLDKEKTKKVNTKAALKWALQDENIHTTIPGCTTFEHLEENLDVMANLEMTPEEKADLEATMGDVSMFCTGCSECLPQCKKGLPIPDLMRSYMYTYGYRDLAMGHEVVSSLGLENNGCAECPECPVTCRSGFNVAEKVQDIIRLKDIPADLVV